MIRLTYVFPIPELVEGGGRVNNHALQQAQCPIF